MKYAFLGYTYQQYVAFLFLSLMDVERRIMSIRQEANVKHDFDDIIVYFENQNYNLQAKDIQDIELNDLIVSEGEISIKGKPHKLSGEVNIILFRYIAIKPDSEVFGFKAVKLSSVYVVSLSREQMEDRIAELYRADQHRRQQLQHFFSKQLDRRKLEIHRSELPTITTFDTRLSDETIKITRHIMEFDTILHIEGKPGVGKSHLVSVIEENFPGSLLYRFWISNQDNYYSERLNFNNFLADLNKKVFNDIKQRSEDEILQAAFKTKKVLILDGLDHVENYNQRDLSNYIDFIEKASTIGRIVVLSRPLRQSTQWKKQVLQNWNFSQTEQILKELYHIAHYTEHKEIYRITSGYPILVKYVAEQFKKERAIPAFAKLNTVSAYYEAIFSKESGKKALSLFLCCRGYFMRSEIAMLADEIHGQIIEQLLDERPYLFEVRLNRIAFFHDSLITFLRESHSLMPAVQDQVNHYVFNSVILGEGRFLARVGLFDLPSEHMVSILRQYCSLDAFKQLISNTIDYESVNEFYNQLRGMLLKIDPEQLNVMEYYELSMVLNIVGRDHLSTLNSFYYTFTRVALQNGYSEEDITSSGYLFGMLLYLKNQDGTYIYNLKADQHYDTSRFYDDLEVEIDEEHDFFETHRLPFERSSIEKALRSTEHPHYHKQLDHCLTNIYIHQKHHQYFQPLYQAVLHYLSGKERAAANLLETSIAAIARLYHNPTWILEMVKKRLRSLGLHHETNEYLTLTLEQYLSKHRYKGSFTLYEELLSYLRLAHRDNRKIDLTSMNIFITKYYNRHDYSLSNIDQALTVFENWGNINWIDSIELITRIQEQSEKGYRTLLSDYLEMHPPDFIKQVLAIFDPKDLRISWLDLPNRHIEMLPTELIHSALSDLFRYNSHDRQVPIKEIYNLLHSGKLDLFRTVLRQLYFFVGVNAKDPDIGYLQLNDIPYKLAIEERDHPEANPEELFNRGIINYLNIDLAMGRGMSASEIARYGDRNGWALAHPEFFQKFTKDKISGNLQHILHSALTGRHQSLDYFHSTFFVPCSTIKIVDDCDAAVDSEDLFKSFKTYLDLSAFPICIEQNNK